VDTNIQSAVKGGVKIKRLLIPAMLLICTMPVAVAWGAPKDIEITPTFVKATAYPSSCQNINVPYKYGTGTFKNYCPHCHHSGVMLANPKKVPEGEWTCKNCDSDWDMQTGYEKDPTGYRLTVYTIQEVKAVEVIEPVSAPVPTLAYYGNLVATKQII
jgi:hypothetical protein